VYTHTVTSRRSVASSVASCWANSNVITLILRAGVFQDMTSSLSVNNTDDSRSLLTHIQGASSPTPRPLRSRQAPRKLGNNLAVDTASRLYQHHCQSVTVLNNSVQVRRPGSRMLTMRGGRLHRPPYILMAWCWLSHLYTQLWQCPVKPLLAGSNLTSPCVSVKHKAQCTATVTVRQRTRK